MKITANHINEACRGETRSGDAVVVRTGGDASLVAVIDALGHGPTAADIAECATLHLADAPLGDMATLMEGLHDALRGTRGAAAMVALLRDGAIDGCGVGNVELRTLGATVPVVQSPGILGVRVRRYKVFSGPIAAGARLMLFSDGISPHVGIGSTRQMDPRAACEYVFEKFRRPHDDATILVVDVEE